MSFDERIRASVDAAVEELRTRVEGNIRALVDQVVSVANDEREQAISRARQTALDEGAEQTALALDQAAQQLSDATAAAAAVLKLSLDEAEAKAAQTLSEADTRAAESLKEAVAAALAREREAELASATRLLESMRALDGAVSLSDVLDALGQAASREAARAAVLVRRHERLVGWKLSGFGALDAQPKAIDLSLNESGVVHQAVVTARPVTTRDSHTPADAPPFADLPADRMGLAVPVIVGGRVVAVVYADTAGHDARDYQVPSPWPEVIEVLARHAARCLEALTVQKTAVTASPRFWVAPSISA